MISTLYIHNVKIDDILKNCNSECISEYRDIDTNDYYLVSKIIFHDSESKSIIEIILFSEHYDKPKF